MTALDVDVVIAVHSPERCVERAVGSVLYGTSSPVRVTVVAHDLDPAVVVGRLGGLARDARVRVVGFVDGVRSPAGPFNHGLDLASAAYTSVLGSDDLLEPGAVDSWLARARRDDADVVVARQRHGGGRPIRTPVTRPWRTRSLDAVRDRLAYRSAPLGLVSRSRFGGLRFTSGVAVGEDVAYVAELWFGGARVSLDRGPAYVVMDDAADRTTMEARSVDAELAYLDVALDVASGLDAAQRTALATKLLRVHVFGVVHNRPEPSFWQMDARRDLAIAAAKILEAAPDAAAPLSRADHELLRAITDAAVPVGTLLQAASARRRFGRPATLVPADLRRLFHREAPPRFMAASVLAGRPARRRSSTERPARPARG
ncbi:glycosyltransferase family A protein [Cellulosimicrobium cellulans]|uniref:glycosyltransferase family A protein n=1 Tax=Cellulosimicrobium cellulans TaxID=1710 RepID=UPI00084836D3|nr:glycosyltransferase family A protein [Cellulosimicrobium cellulans]